MRIADRQVLAEKWFWDNDSWRGEIVLNVRYERCPSYRMLDFDTLYDEWIHAITEIQKNDLTNLTRYQPVFRDIYEEFRLYRPTLGQLFHSLSTGTRERFKNGMKDVWGQYNLLLKHSWKSDDDFKVLLDFLMDLPGRIRFILLTLASQEVEGVDPKPKPFFPSGKFLEGKLYQQQEETGSDQSLFLDIFAYK